MEFTSNEMNHQFKNEIQRPNPATPIACRLCDKVFLGAQALVRHFESSHMVDNKVVPERQCDLNLNKPHTSEPDQFPNLLRPSFSSQQPSLHEMRQFTHTPMKQNPNSNQNPNSSATHVVVSATTQIPSLQPTGNNCTLFPYPPSSLSHATMAVQPEAQPNPPPVGHTASTGGGGGGYTFRPSLTLTSPPLPLVMRNHAFGQVTTTAQETDRVIEMRCARDCTKLYIDKLDRPIKVVVESNDNNGNDRNNLNKLDLTLKL